MTLLRKLRLHEGEPPQKGKKVLLQKPRQAQNEGERCRLTRIRCWNQDNAFCTGHAKEEAPPCVRGESTENKVSNKESRWSCTIGGLEVLKGTVVVPASHDWLL